MDKSIIFLCEIEQKFELDQFIFYEKNKLGLIQQIFAYFMPKRFIDLLPIVYVVRLKKS